VAAFWFTRSWAVDLKPPTDALRAARAGPEVRYRAQFHLKAVP
jgi:hypothetical protein